MKHSPTIVVTIVLIFLVRSGWYLRCYNCEMRRPIFYCMPVHGQIKMDCSKDISSPKCVTLTIKSLERDSKDIVSFLQPNESYRIYKACSASGYCKARKDYLVKIGLEPTDCQECDTDYCNIPKVVNSTACSNTNVIFGVIIVNCLIY